MAFVADSDEKLTFVPDEPKKPSGTLRRIGDIGVSLGKGVASLPELAVGLADIPTGGRAGKFVQDAGVDFKGIQKSISDLYSPEQQEANRKVQEAEGFGGTIKAALQNPSTIVGAVAESAPLLIPGMAAARGLGAVSKLSPLVRGAIGEGLTGAGLAAERTRQETEDGTLSGKQVMSSVGSGAGTALLGAAGGKVAQKLGIGDIDTYLAGQTGQASKQGLVKRTLGGAAAEGLLEEMPQSMQEQVWQNYGLDKPLMEVVPEAGAMGALAGGAMGGAFSAINRGQPTTPPPVDQPTVQPQTVVPPTIEAGFSPAEVESFHAEQAANQERMKRDLEIQRAMGEVTAVAADQFVANSEPASYLQWAKNMDLGDFIMSMPNKVADQAMTISSILQGPFADKVKEQAAARLWNLGQSARIQTIESLPEDAGPLAKATAQGTSTGAIQLDKYGFQFTANIPENGEPIQAGEKYNSASTLKGLSNGASNQSGQVSQLAAQGDEGASADVLGSGSNTQDGASGGLAGGSGIAGILGATDGSTLPAGNAGVQSLTPEFESEQTADAIESTKFNLPEGYSVAPVRGNYGFNGSLAIQYNGQKVGFIDAWLDHQTGEVRINKVELDADHQGKRIAKLAYIGLNNALSSTGQGVLGSDTRSMTQSALNMWKSLVRDGLARERVDGRIGYEFLPSQNVTTSAMPLPEASGATQPVTQAVPSSLPVESADQQTLSPMVDELSRPAQSQRSESEQPNTGEQLATKPSPLPTQGRQAQGKEGKTEGVTKETLQDLGLYREFGGRHQYRIGSKDGTVSGTWFTSNTMDGAIEMATKQYDRMPPETRLTRAQRDAKADAEYDSESERRYGKMTTYQLHAEVDRLNGDIASLQKVGKREFNGNGGRRTGAAVSNEAARVAGEEKMRLERYIKQREPVQVTPPATTKTDEVSTPEKAKQNVGLPLKKEAAEKRVAYLNNQYKSGLLDSPSYVVPHPTIPDRYIVTEVNPDDKNSTTTVAAANEQNTVQATAVQTKVADAEQPVDAVAQPKVIPKAKVKKATGVSDADSVNLSAPINEKRIDSKQAETTAGKSAANTTTPAQKAPDNVARYEAGSKLTKEERKSVLKTLTDVYRSKRADKEERIAANGETYLAYPHQPELFEKSDITGKMVRFYVTLPDGRIAHPTELFQDYSQADVDRAIAKQVDEDRVADQNKKYRLETLNRRMADSLNEANRIFNKGNPGRADYVPAVLTNGKQFIRTSPENATKDVELLGGDWRVQPAATTEQKQADTPTEIAEQAESIAPAEPDYEMQDSKIGDFGRKVLVRKDSATNTGPKAKIAKDVDSRPVWARGIHVFQIEASPNRIFQRDVGKWQIMEEVKGGKGMVRSLTSSRFDTEQQALDAIPLVVVKQRHRVGKQQNGEYGIYRSVTAKKNALVKGGFSTYEAAAEYMGENPAEIIEHKFSYPERPWLDSIERAGNDYRKGKNVTKQMFEKTFSPGAVVYGNWLLESDGKTVNADGQELSNYIYDGLMDLAESIGVPPKALFLDGEMALGIGADGKGGKNSASAHYQPSKGLINLTKIKGAGSLAHEWWHAVDHYFAKNGGRPDADTVSGGFSYKATTRPELMDAIKQVFDKINFAERSTTTDADLVKQRAEKRIKDAVSNLDYYLNDYRNQVKDNPYGRGNKNKKATAEQLAQWDTLASDLRNGDMGADTYVANPSKMRGAIGFSTGEKLIALNALYKQVVGSSFLRSDPQSPGRRMHWTIKAIADNKANMDVKDAVTTTSKGRTDYYIEARRIDQEHTGDYWSMQEELGARAFESYIFDKLTQGQQRSDYLVYAVENRYYAALDLKPYPEGSERAAINAAFDNLFNTIQTKETDKGVALFSRRNRVKGIALRDAEATIDRVSRGFKNLPPIVLHASPNQLKGTYDTLLSEIRAAGALNDVEAAFHDGKIHAFIDNVGSTERLEQVLFEHEVTHYGLRGVFGKDLDPILNNLMTNSFKLRVEANKKKKALGLTSDVEALEEVLADMRPDELVKLKGWQKLVTFMRDWLAAHGFDGLAKKLNGMMVRRIGKEAAADLMVAELVTKSREYARSGKKGDYQADVRLSRQSDTITVGGKRRPRMNSNGKPIAQNDDDLVNFWKWFADSRVVDEKGRPLVVYHGSPEKGLNVIDVDRADPGAWFTTDIRYAAEYSGANGEIYKTYLKAEKPIVVTFDETPNGKLIPMVDNEIFGRKEDDGIQHYKDNYSLVNAAHRIKYIDAVHFPEGNFSEAGETWVVFSPTQIKSATGNAGTFNPSNPDIRFSRASDAIWSTEPISKMDTFLYEVTDKQVDTKRVIEAIKKTGNEIADKWNTYIQEALYHGRTAKKTDDFLHDEAEPLIKKMADAKVTQDELNEYLHARHAIERNRVMKERNPDREDNDGLSGMTDEKAKEVLSNANPALLDIAKDIDTILAKTRKELVEYGLETQDTVDSWSSLYKHYVPLKREGFEDRPGTGMGFAVRGSSTKEATGSHRAVDNILANIAMQREKAIVRGEKNRVALSLYGLAKQFPNSKFWKLDKPAQITQINPDTGMPEVVAGDMADYKVPRVKYIGKDGTVQERVDPNYKGRNNVLTVRINGEDRAIIFNDQEPRAMRMVESLKNLDADQLGEILGGIGKVTRYIASVNTQYNPVFGVVNLMRDVQTAALNLSSTELKGKQKEVLSQTFSALKVIYQDARAVRDGKHPNSSWSKLWEEFQTQGGQTGYRQMFATSKDRADAIEHLLDPAWWQKGKFGKLITINGILAKPEQLLFDNVGKHVFAWLSDYNLAMENSIRLASYKVGIESGMSKEKAAFLAKNLTVNFNKKGRIATQAGALYAFFNASAQGTARIAETLNAGANKGEYLGKVGKQIVYGGITLGAMQAIALMMAGFDEDEPPEFIRERNLVIPAPGTEKGYVAIPMPLGFHVLPNIGRTIVEGAAYGKPIERMTDLLMTMLESFNPIGTGASMAQTISPTVFDPIVALGENKDWTGKQIYREDFNQNDPTPGFTRTKDSTNVLAKAVSYGINAITGGTDYTPGVFSPTPDEISYLVGQATGGVGREIDKAMTTAGTMFTGEDLPTYKVPLFGRLVGTSADNASIRNKFYDNVKSLNLHEAEIKGRIEKRESTLDYINENPESRLVKMASSIETDVRKLQKRKKQFMEEGNRDAVKMVELQIATKMKQLNDRVDSLQR